MFSFIDKFIKPVQISHTYDTSSVESKSIITRSTNTNYKLELSKNILPFQFGLLSNDTTQLHSIFALNNVFVQTSIDNDKNIQFSIQNKIKNITTKFQSIKNMYDIYTQFEIQCLNKYNSLTYKNVNNYNVPIHVFNIMQSVNKNLSLGFEILNFKKNTSCSLITRAENENNIVTIGLQNNGFNCNYFRKINQFFSVASEFIFDGKTINQSMGLKLQTNKANANVEIDNDVNMRINIENKMFDGCNFKVCSEMDLKTGKQTFGLGLSLEK